MTEQEKHFSATYRIVCALVFIVVVLRCIYVPFAHDEVATFYFYIQPGRFLPFLSHVDANGHFLTSATSWICFKLFGSSEMALRLPCIISFIILCMAVSRITEFFSSIVSKVVVSSAFILSFNFIAFFSLCRGYGMSMALLLLSLYYFFNYTRSLSSRHLFKFILFSQLALGANLTLVFVLAIAGAILIFYQLKGKVFFKYQTLLAWLVHFALLGFWIKYAFFLKENGALYYGSGDSYWNVTFKSLIETIALKNSVLNAVVIILFLEMFLYWCYRLFRERAAFLTRNYFSISFITLCALGVAFYILKKQFGVNYPEDRTGLFFYVFFMLSLAFMINGFRRTLQLPFLLVPLFFLVHFIMSCNISVHPWRTYETIPKEFFSILRDEQQKSTRPITVGGHRVREFFYGFLNYNSPEKLSHITSPEALQMNCDYAIAYKHDKPWYDKYYTELAEDKYWDYTLIKRRVPIERKMVYSTRFLAFEGSSEYYNAFEKLDTTFGMVNPLLAEFNISVEKVPVPFKAWLVLQINGDGEGDMILVRTPLDLVKHNWNGTINFTTCIVTGNIPLRIKRVVAYLWNIDKKEVRMTVNSFKLYQLVGDGVTGISNAKL
jgi:hypothetical protein